MSLSCGGATTTTLTPSSLPFASAPACTAAQNGLPEPGPFIATTTVSAACALNAARPSAPATSNSLLLICVLPSCCRTPFARTSHPAQEWVPGLRVRQLLTPHRRPSPQDIDVDGEDDDDADEK